MLTIHSSQSLSALQFFNTNNMKINLNNVTLCVADCLTPELSLRAIKKSQELCNFERSIIFTDNDQLSNDSCEVIAIKKLESINDYSYFVLKELAPHIKTEFALVIQWDGYVTEPMAWNEKFRQYDYIGAKWGWHQDGNNVGNGGFSLRSQRLLKATSDPTFTFIKDLPEDDQICRHHKEFLTKKYGIKFAPEEIADKFSYERSLPNSPTFGFHGLFNMWRHCQDEEIICLIEKLSTRTYKSREFAELMIQYFCLRKFKPIKFMYKKIMSVQSRHDFSKHISQLTNDQKFSIFFTDLCDSMTSK